jgi:hypothetical protein
MASRDVIADSFPEASTQYISFTITDVDGVTPLADADDILDVLEVTLFTEKGSIVINNRSGNDILGTNGGSVTNAGLVTLRLDPEDMPSISKKAQENHIAMFVAEWGSNPTIVFRHEILFTVDNLAKVP